jgi:tRNA(adenine34) deaminase
MREALAEAKRAYALNEVPVGCVIVRNQEIIARAHNLREHQQTTLAHAEILAIHEACEAVGSWRLEDCDIYITLEPCIMCSGAIINSRIKTVVYGTDEPKFGAHQSLINVFDLDTNHHPEVISGVLAEESNRLLKQFFKKLRSEKN